MGFQIILSVLIFIAIIKLCTQFFKRHMDLVTFSFFLACWILGFFLIWSMRFLNKIGDLLGLAYGVNILVYSGIFLIFYCLFIGALKIYKLEKDIGKMVKKETLKDFIGRYNLKR